MFIHAKTRADKSAKQLRWARMGFDSVQVRGGIEVNLPSDLEPVVAQLVKYGRPVDRLDRNLAIQTIRGAW